MSLWKRNQFLHNEFFVGIKLAVHCLFVVFLLVKTGLHEPRKKWRASSQTYLFIYLTYNGIHTCGGYYAADVIMELWGVLWCAISFKCSTCFSKLIITKGDFATPITSEIMVGYERYRYVGFYEILMTSRTPRNFGKVSVFFYISRLFWETFIQTEPERRRCEAGV